MRHWLLFLSFALGVSCYPYYPLHAQGYPPNYNPPEASPPQAPYNTSSREAYAGRQTYAGTGENCGTPDEPKSCPPLPRHPLPYYPANRQ